MAMTHLFFFMEMVLMEGVGWVNLRDTSKLDEASSSLLFHPNCTASLLLGRAPEGEALHHRVSAGQRCLSLEIK